MNNKGVIATGIIILMLFLALCATSLYVSFSHWSATWAILKGKPIYTEEQIKEYSKEQNKENVLLIKKLQIELELTQMDLEAQTNSNLNNIELLKNKQTELTTKTAELSALQIENAEDKGKIFIYENQINNLREQLKTEQSKNIANEETILNLNNQISILSTEKGNLESIVTSKTNTIDLLNSQLLNLNSTITELTNTINTQTSLIQKLTARVNELNESVKYYELLVASYNFEDKAVVTFKYNDSVYALQVVDKGATVTTTTPVDTDYIKFNYWTLNNEQIDLATLHPTENIELVANLTYYYDLKYYDGEQLYTSAIIEKGQTPSNLILSNNLEKYFLGWSLDGRTIIDLNNLTIVENTNLYAVWENFAVVTFMINNEQYSETLKVFKNSSVSAPTEPILTKGTFLGWRVNEKLVNVANYKINADTTFVADIVEMNNSDFVYSSNIFSDGTDYYCFDDEDLFVFDKKIRNWKFISSGSINSTICSFSRYMIDGDVYIFSGRLNYIFDKTTKVWKIYKIFDTQVDTKSCKVWTDGVDTYFYSLSGETYIFDKTTKKFIENGLFYDFVSNGSSWTDGENYYFVNSNGCYLLNHKTSSLIDVGISNFNVSCVWNFNGNTYYSEYVKEALSNGVVGVKRHYVFDKTTKKFIETTWNGYSNFSGSNIWNDSEHAYISAGITQYVFSELTNTWIIIKK